MIDRKTYPVISPAPSGISLKEHYLRLPRLQRFMQAARGRCGRLLGLRPPSDFEATLRMLPSAPTLGGWVHTHRSQPSLFSAALHALVDAADEAVDLPNGKTQLPAGVSVAFRQDVIVRYLRDCNSEDGATFHALLFTIGTDAEVVVWVEDDGHRSRLAYRGVQQAVQRAGMEANLFRGRCFTDSTKPPAQYQHIVRLPR